MVTDSKKLLGSTLGNSTLERQIGRGGMGAVYIARQLRPRRAVAVKVLLPGAVLDEKAQSDFLTRFRREADAIAALDHIHIMPIYEYGEQDQLAYLVMPYVTGGTLRQILGRRGALPLNEILPIIEQAAEALDYAHERGIIHRDIKPGNILFHADGRLLLADFGLAKVLSETTQIAAIVIPPPEEREISSEDDEATEDDEVDTLISERASSSISEGTLIGTPEYLSPEQAMSKPVDRRTDIYSLGIVLFHMLTGQVPYIGSTPLATAFMHIQSEPPSLCELSPAISPMVEAVVRRAIDKQPDKRYSTAGDLARALRTAAEYGDPTTRHSTAHSLQGLSDNDTVPEMEQIHPFEEATVQMTPPVALALEASTPAQTSRGTGSPWRTLILCFLLAVLVLGGGFFAYLTFLSSDRTTFAHTEATPTLQPTINPTPQIKPGIHAGQLLYASALPGAQCSPGNGMWSADKNAVVTCGQNGTQLTNNLPGGQHILASLFLNTLKRNGVDYGVPGDYILQVQVQTMGTPQGNFGIFFRNQPDAGSYRHNGTYAFLLGPAGTWEAVAYDDKTGAPTPLTSPYATTVPLTGLLTIDIQIKGNTFVFFLNGVKQGTAIDATYSSGTLGFTVSTGTSILLKNLAIYEIPSN